MNYLWVGLAGVLAGFVGGLLGVGGGVILVPVFIFLLHMDAHLAIGTSLAIIVPTALVGAIGHHLNHFIDYRVFFWVSLFSILGAVLGSQLSVSLAAPLLKRLFAVFMFFLSIYIFFRG